MSHAQDIKSLIGSSKLTDTNSMKRILLVEDQPEFQMLVRQILRDGEHEIFMASTIGEAVKLLSKNTYDLILLDITLPDRNGLDYYAELQSSETTKDIPVIFLTGSDSPVNKITAFNLGAEDYVTKPFHFQEFKARVKAKLKKSKTQMAPAAMTFGPFHFNLNAQRVTLVNEGIDIDLTPKEFRIFYCLARKPETIVTRENLLNEVWGKQVNVNDRTVDSHIYVLRKKLGEYSGFISAVQGEGYRFSLQPKKKKVA
jgi:DNA-binding response OmpR family regulator